MVDNGTQNQEVDNNNGASPRASSDEDETREGGGDQAAAQVQAGEELEAGAPEGGGAQGALVTTNGHGSGRHFEVDADSAGNIAQITFFKQDGQDVVMQRPPEGSDDLLLWQLYETTRFQGKRKRNELQQAINQVHSAVASLVSPNQLREGASAPSATAAVLAVNGRYPPPQQIPWKSKPLPERVARVLQDTYFLKIDEQLADRHGNQYVPAKRPDANNKLKWRGSRLADKFPHAVISKKDSGEGVSSRSHQYICGEVNVYLNVRLMRRVEGGAPVQASECEVIKLIEDAYSPAQRATWDDLDGKMYMYMYLEFEDEPVDGMPVNGHAFENPPDYGAIFKPPSSQPSYLQNGEVSYYEYKMINGVAPQVFSFANRATNTNLRSAHKNKRFRLVVKALNYHLVNLEGFTARSVPFLIKGVLHNDVKGTERYVINPQGNVVDSPVSDMP